MEIFVPLAGLLDLDEEKTRLQKEIAKVEADLASVSRKLENPNFVAKAPPDVVEKDRARIVELKQKSAKLAENLARIRPVPTPNPGNGSPEGAVEESRESGEGGGPKNNGNAVDLRGELDERLLVRNKDRAGTDHYELGVAYIGAGLADKAAEAFDAAEKAKAKPGRGKKLKPASAGRKASKRKTAKSKGRKVTKAKVRPKVRRNRKR